MLCRLEHLLTSRRTRHERAHGDARKKKLHYSKMTPSAIIGKMEPGASESVGSRDFEDDFSVSFPAFRPFRAASEEPLA